VKKKFNNSSWNFYLDKVYTYAYWDNLFTKKECEKIIKVAKKKGFIKATTLNKTEVKSDVRSSDITWLYVSDDLEWVFQRVTDAVLNLNDRFFKFYLFCMRECFKFTNYNAPTGKYGKHIDRSIDIPVRKLSLSIQLTDPKEYQGGDLYLYQEEKGDIMKKEQGTLILFPSYILHEVKPITKGERNSLVSWVTGKQFK